MADNSKASKYVEDRRETIYPHRVPTADISAHSEYSAQASASGFSENEAEHITLDRDAHSVAAKPMSKAKLYWRRFLRNKMAVFGGFIFIALVLFAVFGGFFAQWDYREPDFLALSEGPSSEHWFGTSSSGNDLYAMIVHGLGRSLTIALIVSISTTIISAIYGTGIALLGGWVEKIGLGIIHFLMVVPSFLIIALLVNGSGGDWKILTVTLVAFGWIGFARVLWTMSISLREREYIRAAHYMGVSPFTILVRHMIPNIGSLIIINTTLGVVSAVMAETGLSFLNLGVKIPDVSLGTLLSTGANSLESSPWEFYFPAAVLTLLTTSMAYVADGLRDALDPNSKAGGTA